MEEAAGRAASIGDPIGRLAGTGARCEAYLAIGKAEEALPLAHQYLTLRRALKAPGFVAWALKLLGDVLSRQTPPQDAEAEASYTEALAIATQLSMEPLRALALLGLARLHARAGRAELASENHQQANKLLRSVRMTFWLDSPHRI